jgi:hypothetical protein
MDECWVDDERVTAQESDYYGGWMMSGIVGPFKVRPGQPVSAQST